MKIEIEVKSPDAKNDIYELRNYLLENVKGMELRIKEMPARDGEMSGSISETIVTGLLHVAVALPLEELYQLFLKPKIEEWLEARRHKAKGKLEVMSTLKDDTAKTHFLEDSEGTSQIYNNLRYAIDTDNTYAVLIGCSEFDNSFPAIPPVKGNIEDLLQLLTDKRHIGLPAENVAVAFNKSNTEIEELLLRTSRRQGIETLILYYAGHGHRSDIKKLYLTASNTKKIDDYILGGVDFDFLNNIVLRSSTARQKIVILDACHSGIAAQGQQDLANDIDVNGSYILTSSPGDEVSYFQKDQRNTYFTGALLQLLTTGIDSSNDMLTLEDFYDYTNEKLGQRNFPKPAYKSELSIPPSNFYIARNPSFSPEKLKRKPSQLLKQGRLEEALYEYRLLLQRFPEDMQLRKEATECETQIVFTRLAQEGDELYFKHHDYRTAIEKYRKALQVKEDYMLLDKIRRCEEFLRTGNGREEKKQVTSESLREELRPAGNKTVQTIKNNLSGEAIPEKKKEPIPVIKKEKEEPVKLTVAPNRKSIAGISIAIAWLILSILVHIVFWKDMDSTLEIFSRLSIPCLVGGAMILGFRYAKASADEIIIYTTGAFAAMMILAAHIANSIAERYGFLFMLILFLAYLFLFNKLYKKLAPVGFITGMIPNVLFPFIFIVNGFVIVAYGIIGYSKMKNFAFVGYIIALLVIAALVYYFTKAWQSARKEKESIL